MAAIPLTTTHGSGTVRRGRSCSPAPARHPPAMATRWLTIPRAGRLCFMADSHQPARPHPLRICGSGTARDGSPLAPVDRPGRLLGTPWTMTWDEASQSSAVDVRVSAPAVAPIRATGGRGTDHPGRQMAIAPSQAWLVSPWCTTSLTAEHSCSGEPESGIVHPQK